MNKARAYHIGQAGLVLIFLQNFKMRHYPILLRLKAELRLRSVVRQRMAFISPTGGTYLHGAVVERKDKATRYRRGIASKANPSCRAISLRPHHLLGLISKGNQAWSLRTTGCTNSRGQRSYTKKPGS